MSTFVRNPGLPAAALPQVGSTSGIATGSLDQTKLIEDLEKRLGVLLNEGALGIEAEKCVRNIKAELERLGVPKDRIDSINI